MQIIDDIMEQILSKTLRPGEKLPSENELADHYRVPRMTVRSALVKLEERGLVYTIQGKGRYLREKSKQIQLHLTGHSSFTDKMNQLGYHLLVNLFHSYLTVQPQVLLFHHQLSLITLVIMMSMVI
ncbi:winged helix-turn-helix domain-containing protein [Amphibacillus indicireducens]